MLRIQIYVFVAVWFRDVSEPRQVASFPRICCFFFTLSNANNTFDMDLESACMTCVHPLQGLMPEQSVASLTACLIVCSLCDVNVFH